AVAQLDQGGEGGFDDVVGVGGADTLGKDIGDADRLHDGADGAAGDDAGAGGGRLEQHPPAAVGPEHGVRDGGLVAVNLDEVLLRRLDPLADGARHFLAL